MPPEMHCCDMMLSLPPLTLARPGKQRSWQNVKEGSHSVAFGQSLRDTPNAFAVVSVAPEQACVHVGCGLSCVHTPSLHDARGPQLPVHEYPVTHPYEHDELEGSVALPTGQEPALMGAAKYNSDCKEVPLQGAIVVVG